MSSVYSEVVRSKLLPVWTVLFALHIAHAGEMHYKSSRTFRKEASPSFDMIITEIDASEGETVLLPCTVRNIGDKVVSWMRTSDLSILTSGAFTFSADSRFECVHSAEADFWGLRIRGVKISDTGQYECQVNSDPKMNLAVNLSVIERFDPTVGMSYKYAYKAIIKSSREMTARSGSAVSLTCEITPTEGVAAQDENFFPKKARVRWLHNGREITSESDRGGISIDTEYRESSVRSHLRVSTVNSGQDGGLYTCTHDSASQDSVSLTVIEGEHSEAMQRDAAFSSSCGMSLVDKILLATYMLLHLN